MISLNDHQKQRAIEVMREWLSARDDKSGTSAVQIGRDHDAKRIAVIEHEMKPQIQRFLNGSIPLAEFKTKVDGINKRNELWGFRGIKGQMFFNMVVNVADNLDECDQEIKAAIAVPDNDQIASSRIKTLENYVKRLGNQWVDAGNTRHGSPKPNSIPFFLSFFWQIQDRSRWNVYYTNSVQTMTDLNLWQPSGDIAKDYLDFNDIHAFLRDLFTKESGQPFDLYMVEHVFWYKGGNPYDAAKEAQREVDSTEPIASTVTASFIDERLPESYVPPMVAVIPRMARHEETLVDAAKKSGTTLERAFEKFINAAFTILHYETKLLGQGQGRVPDGMAFAQDDNYAIIWDAKVRKDGYSIGTDDRTIREYITTQSRDLKRRRSLRNIYYFIVSSGFADDFDDTIRTLKMDTDVNEVILLEAEALVAMVDAKLRDPLQVTLGPDGFQRLYSVSGVLTADDVRGLFV